MFFRILRFIYSQFVLICTLTLFTFWFYMYLSTFYLFPFNPLFWYVVISIIAKDCKTPDWSLTFNLLRMQQSGLPWCIRTQTCAKRKKTFKKRIVTTQWIFGYLKMTNSKESKKRKGGWIKLKEKKAKDLEELANNSKKLECFFQK